MAAPEGLQRGFGCFGGVLGGVLGGSWGGLGGVLGGSGGVPGDVVGGLGGLGEGRDGFKGAQEPLLGGFSRPSTDCSKSYKNHWFSYGFCTFSLGMPAQKAEKHSRPGQRT